LKMQLRIDALERRETQTEARVTYFEGVIHNLDSLLSDQPSSSLPATQATHSASAPTIHNLGVSSDDDMLLTPEDDTLDNADTDNELTINDVAESSTAPPHRSASAPTTASAKHNKRRRRTPTLMDALSIPLSKNTRAHSRR
jgi:hypothetical protein